MPANKDNIALDIGARGAAAAGNFIEALDELSDVANWASKAQIDYTDPGFKAAIQNSPELQHLDGEELNELFNEIAPAISAFLAATAATSGDTYEENLQKVRRS